MRNLVFIGMPGSGKSAVGRECARRLGYSFFDTDAMVEQAAGMSISAMFEEFGQEHFRDLESAAARRAAAERRAVISCGGGMILREENMVHLAKSGRVLFLHRALEDILTADLSNRPLVENQREQLEKLYTERIELYKKYAEYIINNRTTVVQAAAEAVAYYREREGLA